MLVKIQGYTFVRGKFTSANDSKCLDDVTDEELNKVVGMTNEFQVKTSVGEKYNVTAKINSVLIDRSRDLVIYTMFISKYVYYDYIPSIYNVCEGKGLVCPITYQILNINL